MKSYQFSCCQRDANGNLVELTIKTEVVSAETRSDALNQLKTWFETNNCLPYREVT